jgi:DNA-binding CsgD family transcriptional regulator
MVDIKNLESVVLSIYDATSEPSRWPRVLDTVSDIMDARGAFLFDIDQRGDPSKARTNYGPNLVKDCLDVHNAQELEDQAIFAACSCSLDRTELIPDSGFALFSLDATQPIDLDMRFIADAYSLTESKEAVLKLRGEGLTNAQISERRSRSLETVSSQVKALLSKTVSRNRTQLIRLATEHSPRLFIDSSIPF